MIARRTLKALNKAISVGLHSGQGKGLISIVIIEVFL